MPRPKPRKYLEHPTGLYYRPDTKDERIITEVVEQRTYRNKRIKFDVEPGERWLDLGAHIGTFGHYAFLMGAASVMSIEPDYGNFKVLEKNSADNSKWQVRRAVFSHTASKQMELLTPTSRREGAIPNSKYSIFPMSSYVHKARVDNICFNRKNTKHFDAIKMDIEGAEHKILDNIHKNIVHPNVQKMVIEYHFIKNRSLKDFHRRMENLREVFRNVYMIPSLEKMEDECVAGNLDEYPGFFDRLIYCWR